MEAARQYLDQHKVQEVISKAVSAAYKARAENLESFLVSVGLAAAAGVHFVCVCVCCLFSFLSLLVCLSSSPALVDM